MRTELDPKLLEYFNIGFPELNNLMRANHDLSLKENELVLNETIEMCEHFTWDLGKWIREETLNKNYKNIEARSKLLNDQLTAKIQPILLNRITNTINPTNKTIDAATTKALNNLKDLGENCLECIEWQTWPSFDELREVSWKQSLDAFVDFHLKVGTPYFTDDSYKTASFIQEQEGYRTLIFKQKNGSIYSYMTNLSYEFSEKEFLEQFKATKIFLKQEDLRIEKFQWESKRIPLFLDNNLITQKQIEQGRISDSFLLASIISKTETDSSFFYRKIVEDPDTNLVYVKLFEKTNQKKFTPVYIEVNKETIVYKNGQNQENILALDKHVLWPAILEKAHAIYNSKIANNGINKINAIASENNALKFLMTGHAQDCMEMLTGDSYQEVNLATNFNGQSRREFINLILWNGNQQRISKVASDLLNNTTENDQIKQILEGMDSYFWKNIVPKDWKDRTRKTIQKQLFQNWMEFLESNAVSYFFKDRIDDSPPGVKNTIDLNEFRTLLDGSARYKFTRFRRIKNTIISEGLRYNECCNWIENWMFKEKIFSHDSIHEPSIIMTTPQIQLYVNLSAQIKKSDFPVLTIKRPLIGDSPQEIDERNYVLNAIRNTLVYAVDPSKTGAHLFVKNRLNEFENNKSSRNLIISPFKFINWVDSYTKKVEE